MAILLKFWKHGVVIIALAAVFFYWNGRSQRIKLLETQNQDLQLEVLSLNSQMKNLLEANEKRNAEVMRWRNATEDFQDEVDRLESLPPPPAVVKIREVIKTVDSGITAVECPDAISEAAALIKGVGDAPRHN